MALQIRRAERRKAKLRLGLFGVTGSGKTYSALKLAFGLGGKIGLVDTEHGSGDLYASLGEYDVITLEPPFTVPKYREAIRAFEEAGYDVIIVDSLTHAWAGEGGLLDKQGQLEKDTARFKNSWATWREITPEHNRLVEELIGSTAHIIATLRVKTEYVLEPNSKGKMEPRKVGLAPVFRDGIEYEFTVTMDIADNHVAKASKDRTMLFDGWYDQISEETGRKLKAWLDSGTDAVPLKAAATTIKAAPRVVAKTNGNGNGAAEPDVLDGDLGYDWLVALKKRLAGAGDLNAVTAIGGHVRVNDAISRDDTPPKVKQQITELLADAYAKFTEATPDDADAANEPDTIDANHPDGGPKIAGEQYAGAG
jgi:hypothetical protein